MKRRCPDCKSWLIFDEANSAWTEAKDLVVIPLVCPDCGYTVVKNLKIPPPKAYEVFTKPSGPNLLYFLKVGHQWYSWTPMFGWQEYTGKKGGMTESKRIPEFVHFKVRQILNEMQAV